MRAQSPNTHRLSRRWPSSTTWRILEKQVNEEVDAQVCKVTGGKQSGVNFAAEAVSRTGERAAPKPPPVLEVLTSYRGIRAVTRCAQSTPECAWRRESERRTGCNGPAALVE